MATEIIMHLLDYTTAGRVAFFLEEWDGYACKIPRIYSGKCSRMVNIREKGIILLFGTWIWNGGTFVHICSAGDTNDRPEILEMLGEFSKKNSRKYGEWSNAVIFTEPRGTLNTADIRYLKRRLYDIIRKADKADVQNEKTPRKQALSEAREKELEKTLSRYIMAAEMLGFYVFGTPADRIPERRAAAASAPSGEMKSPVLAQDAADVPGMLEEVFSLFRKVRGIGIVGARLKRCGSGYVLLAGSDISPRISMTCSSIVLDLRDKAKIENGKLVEDIPVQTPSAAASVVLGYNISAWDLWLTSDGRTIEDVYPGEMNRLRGGGR